MAQPAEEGGGFQIQEPNSLEVGTGTPEGARCFVSEQSEQINELAGALAKAQGKITGALKDSANPFFKSKYADLASVWDACRSALSENGLAIVQQTESDDSGVFVITTLAHSSGQWMRSRLRLTPKDDSPQAMGSAITYGRRYALAAAVGVAQVDDDGNAASGRGPSDPRGENRAPQDESLVKQYVDRFKKAMDNPDDDIAAADVFKIHGELAGQNDLYIAVGDALGSKYKNALHKFVQLAKRKAA
jgi:hypothetical protein